MPADIKANITTAAIFAGIPQFLREDERPAGSPPAKELDRAAQN
ncbi:MAG TPA: hypothetical protein VGL00_01750 [Terracidiphilus sp.]|jgi:hypothetical protein